MFYLPLLPFPNPSLCSSPCPSPQTFPKPWSVTSFIDILLAKLAHPLVGNDIKADICRVIQDFLKIHKVQNKANIYTTILTQLKGPPTLSTTVAHEKMFVLNGLQLLMYLDKMDAELAVLLMVHYIECDDSDQRTIIMNYFKRHGLKDPHQYFTAAMMEMPLDSSPTPLCTNDLFNKAQDWLDYWAEELSLAKPKKSTRLTHTLKCFFHVSHLIIARKSPKTPKETRQKVGFLTTEASLCPDYKPIDVINYFISVEHERVMARYV